MRTSREILRAHYERLFKRLGLWSGLTSILIASLVAVPANAAQLTDRSLTLGSSAASANTTYAFSFEPGQTATVGSIKFELCTSPLAGTCTQPSNATMAGAGGLSLSGEISGFTVSNGTNNPSPTATTVWIENGTPQSLTAATASGVSFTGIVNPDTANYQFYARITTYAETAGSTQRDFGGIAVSTAAVMTVNANVQESLVFCVGATVGANCTGIGSSSITLAPNPLTTAAVSYNTAQMGAATNAISGYTIAYYSTDMCISGCTYSITKAADGGTVAATGGEQFGFVLAAQSSGLLNGQGANHSGGTGATVSSPYDGTNSTIAYDTTGPTTLATASGPTTQTTYTMLYAANVSATTEPGAYSATQTFVATGIF